MYYGHGGMIYGMRLENGAQLWERVTVVRGTDGAACIVGTGDSVDALPPGALPMTHAEVLARVPAKTEAKKRRAQKVVNADVPETR